MISRKELKSLSKEQLRGQWTTVVLITLIFGVINFIDYKLTASFESSFLISIFSYLLAVVMGIFSNSLYLKLTRGVKVKFTDMFVSGSTFLKAIGITLLQALIMIPAVIISIIIGSFVFIAGAAGIGITENFIIPSNVESFVSSVNSAYFFKFFLVILLIVLIISIPIMILGFYLYPSLILICEDDTRGVGECIGTSFRLMHGNLWKYIVLQLSYIGWILAGILTLGIGYLWLFPYINTVNMNFFNQLVGYDSIEGNPEQLLY
ncbi:DUF975 family protein [Clostridium culturomicium]|uniref:DUF975 family protein n=1 Tax=Clostridium culturomicium TaxID=1499683 RepID=UPI0038573108